MSRDKKMAKARAMSQQRARAAEHEADAKRPLPKTWSARHPAYAGTVLCMDPGRGKSTGKGEEARCQKIKTHLSN